MSQSFEERGVPLVRMTSNLNLLRRRLRGAISLANSGARPRWGYGENSTAPMPLEARAALVTGLKDLRNAGLRFAWYVRDFHWLDPDSPVSQSRIDIGELRENGLAEFDAMKEIADVLFAPSSKSAQNFDELLRSHSHEETNNWRILPPGVDPANCLLRPARYPDQHETLCIVYAGGVGGVYDMAIAMTAMTGLSANWELQMTVRPEDIDAAHQLTSDLPKKRVNITSGEFIDVSVPSGATAGIALLDSSYGQASFPLKVMSYFEKKIPVLVYRDSSPAVVVETYGAGRVPDHTPQSVKAELEAMISGSDSIDWQLLREEESWSSRAQLVRNELSGLSDR